MFFLYYGLVFSEGSGNKTRAKNRPKPGKSSTLEIAGSLYQKYRAKNPGNQTREKHRPKPGKSNTLEITRYFYPSNLVQQTKLSLPHTSPVLISLGETYSNSPKQPTLAAFSSSMSMESPSTTSNNHPDTKTIRTNSDF